MTTISAKLKERGLILPAASAPAASYVPYVRSGNLLYISGQLPMRDGQLAYTGKAGANRTVADAKAAAELCAVNLLGQLSAATGGALSSVKRCIRLGGWVNCTDDFGDQPAVINGASELMLYVFGAVGHHARAAVGTNALPFNALTEVEGLFEIA